VAPLGRSDDESCKRRLDEVVIGGARPLVQPIEIRAYDREWPELYVREEARIRSILAGRVIRIEHVGSTSVAGMPAKPVIDIVLEVTDSSEEDAYARDLEAAGYQLSIREPEWYEHRLFKGPDTNINLHAFSAGCDEVERMLRFRDHLRTDASDRELYANVKRELAARDWKYAQQYADAKTAIVREILARADR
jgi:GrpB-like predicted nucleotidyltransferase (UPF0157 family)